MISGYESIIEELRAFNVYVIGKYDFYTPQFILMYQEQQESLLQSSFLKYGFAI